jgi:hypothetical protein
MLSLSEFMKHFSEQLCPLYLCIITFPDVMKLLPYSLIYFLTAALMQNLSSSEGQERRLSSLLNDMTVVEAEYQSKWILKRRKVLLPACNRSMSHKLSNIEKWNSHPRIFSQGQMKKGQSESHPMSSEQILLHLNTISQLFLDIRDIPFTDQMAVA